MAFPVVSLIIAYHNAASTIERCVNSVLSQPEADKVELVFVDDGSNDSTTEIAKRCVEESAFGDAIFLTLENPKGVAEATREGMRAAKGEYLMRIDSDDELSPGALYAFFEALSTGNPDVVWGGLTVNRDGKLTVLSIDKRADLLNDTPIDTVHFSLCNKFIRRSLIIDNDLLPFSGINCWEDLGVVTRVFALRPKIAYIDCSPYIYHVDSAKPSLSRSRKEVLLNDHLACARNLDEWFESRGLSSNYSEFLTRLKFVAKVKFLRGRDKQVDKWKTTFPEVNNKILSIKHIPYAYRLLFATVNSLPAAFSQRIANWIGSVIKA